MTSKQGLKKGRVLIVGPMPPPHGGATVSFDRFLTYVRQAETWNVTHVNLPAQRKIRDEKPRRISFGRTAWRLLAVLCLIPRVERVVLFASRGSAFSYGLVIIVASRILGRPVTLRLFGGRPYLRIRDRWWPLKRVTDWALGFATKIVVETGKAKDDFPDSLHGIVGMVTGYRPTVPLRDPTDDEDGSFRFVFVGRVDASKGIDILLQTSEQLAARDNMPRFSVDCFGHSSDEMLALAHEHPHVHLKGVVENVVLMDRLPSYHGFVYPSQYDNEGHPGAVIEAMLAGLPIICTDLETVVEIVHDNVNGLVVPLGDATALADAMGNLICDSALRSRLRVGVAKSGAAFDEQVVLPRLARALGL